MPGATLANRDGKIDEQRAATTRSIDSSERLIRRGMCHFEEVVIDWLLEVAIEISYVLINFLISYILQFR